MRLFLFAFFIFTAISGFSQAENAARRRNFNTENFIALRQFDPVSYFKGKPMKGSEKVQFDYKGITYYFASDANKEEFSKSPDKYEPAYGGWCAYTVATKGERVKVDPTSYKIVKGRLFLFYNFNTDNRMLKWNSSTKRNELITAADKKWKLR